MVRKPGGHDGADNARSAAGQACGDAGRESRDRRPSRGHACFAKPRVPPAVAQGGHRAFGKSAPGGAARAVPRDAAEQRSIEASAAGPPASVEPLDGPRILASGVFVNGTVGLQIGSRYLIALDGERLMVLGPADEDPSSVVFDRSVHEMDATGLNERLILNQRSNARGASILAFISLAGGTPDGVAEEGVQAALAVGSQP